MNGQLSPNAKLMDRWRGARSCSPFSSAPAISSASGERFCKVKSTHWLFADLVSLDDKRQRAKFVVKSGSQQAVEAIESFALRGDSVIVGGRTVGSVLEDGIALSKSRDIAFEVAVTSSSDWKLLSKAVVTGASLALHTRKDGGAWLDSITLRDAAPRNLGATEKFDQGDVLMKGSGFGERHTMTIGRGGSSAGGLSTTEFLDLLKGFRKTNESNRDHLMHAHGHLEKVGEHLTAAKARYPFDNNVRGAVASHESAMECLKEIDLPPGDADAPEARTGAWQA